MYPKLQRLYRRKEDILTLCVVDQELSAHALYHVSVAFVLRKQMKMERYSITIHSNQKKIRKELVKDMPENDRILGPEDHLTYTKCWKCGSVGEYYISAERQIRLLFDKSKHRGTLRACWFVCSSCCPNYCGESDCIACEAKFDQTKGVL